jgi:hypothetical protein
MGRDVIDKLAIEINLSAIAQARNMLFATLNHHIPRSASFIDESSVVHRKRPFGAALVTGKISISTTKENQRLVLRICDESVDPANEDDVIAAIMVRVRGAFKMR